VATASLWANVLARPTSIRAESARLLREAQDEARRSTPPAEPCPAGCTGPSGPEILFRSVPRRVRSDYSGAAYCAATLEQTAAHPLTYSRHFASQSELGNWIYDLAMGDGPDGKHLYERCDNSCSPRYTYLIRPEADGLAVETSVICGHARDRDDNKFELSYSVRWSCDGTAPGGTAGASAAAR
jgi:hypothetical protein